jgi:hypothetical protein
VPVPLDCHPEQASFAQRRIRASRANEPALSKRSVPKEPALSKLSVPRSLP